MKLQRFTAATALVLAVGAGAIGGMMTGSDSPVAAPPAAVAPVEVKAVSVEAEPTPEPAESPAAEPADTEPVAVIAPAPVDRAEDAADRAENAAERAETAADRVEEKELEVPDHTETRALVETPAPRQSRGEPVRPGDACNVKKQDTAYDKSGKEESLVCYEGTWVTSSEHARLSPPQPEPDTSIDPRPTQTESKQS